MASAFALSDRLAPRLAGIEGADSVTVDFHKLWFQPISASALVVADAAGLDGVTGHSDYLRRSDDVADGQLNLVGRSLDTSRRFDALKVLLTLRALGRRRMAGLVEHLVDLADHAHGVIEARDDLEAVAPVETVTVLFRRRPDTTPTPTTTTPSPAACSTAARPWSAAPPSAAAPPSSSPSSTRWPRRPTSRRCSTS